MHAELLEKEVEFHKENEKIELQTKKLLQKVNDVMRIQENLIKDTLKTKTDLSLARQARYSFPKPSTTNNKMGRLEDLAKDIEECLNVPSTVDNACPDAVNYIYKAKIKTVLAEKEKMQCEMKHSNEELRKLQRENQQLTEEKEKWFLSYNSGKVTTGKLEAQIVTLNSKIQTKDSENAALRKEVEQLKKELKQNNLNLNNTEVRLNRAYEEIEKLKTALKNSKEEEKESKESYKRQISELQTVVKVIEKHKIELLNGFKKQMQLIDVLKKQKIQLETHQLAQLAEADYLKILDWKLD